MAKVRQTQTTYHFSTELRNTEKYPHTNDFLIQFPHPIHNIVNISLQSISIHPVSELVRKGVNDTVMYSEGYRFGYDSDANSTKFTVTVDGGVPTDVYVPAYLNKSISNNGSTELEFEYDIGMAVADTHVHSYLIGYGKDLHHITSDDVSSISGNTLVLTVAKTINTDLFLCTEPLSPAALMQCVNRQLSGIGITMYQDGQGRFYFKGRKAFSVSYSSSSYNCLHILGFSNMSSDSRHEIHGNLPKNVMKAVLSPFVQLKSPNNPSEITSATYTALHPGCVVNTHMLHQTLATATPWTIMRVDGESFTQSSYHWFRSPTRLASYLTQKLTGCTVTWSGTQFRFTKSNRFDLDFDPRSLSGANFGLQGNPSSLYAKMLGFQAEKYLSTQTGTSEHVIESVLPVNWPSHPYTFKVTGSTCEDTERQYSSNSYTLSPAQSNRFRMFTNPIQTQRTSTFALSTFALTGTDLEDLNEHLLPFLVCGDVVAMEEQANPGTMIYSVVKNIDLTNQTIELFQTYGTIAGTVTISSVSLVKQKPVFEIYNEPSLPLANKVLGINSLLKNGSTYIFPVQFDLIYSYEFYVVFNNLSNTYGTNFLWSSVQEEMATVAILKTGAPYQFDRGAPAEVHFTTPVKLDHIHIKLLEKDGITLVNTGDQEFSISITVTVAYPRM